MESNRDNLRQSREMWREHRRLRFRRHSRRAYIRSVYALPSLATLGNAICGFAAIYVATLDPQRDAIKADPITRFLAEYRFFSAAYLIFVAMIFDALDGRLARFARHTTDFGGQLDSLADVISFGCAPAFIALQLFRHNMPEVPLLFSRSIWAIGALYVSCAAIRLARFNVSNEHGEQHHFSFLGLPSPGAAAAVVATILLHERLHANEWDWVANAVVIALPLVVLGTGLLMVSQIRYPHLVNRYLRGKKTPAMLVLIVAILLGIYVAHWYVLAAGTLAYAASGVFSWALARWRRPSPSPVS
jgi:CDP-diacylglycerol---serine O-phosphatidyltransferase